MGIIRRAIRVKLSSILKGTREKKIREEKKNFWCSFLRRSWMRGEIQFTIRYLSPTRILLPKKKFWKLNIQFSKVQFSYMGWRKLWHFYVVINRVFCCTASFLSGDKLLRSMIHKMAAVARGPRIQSWPIRLLLWRNSLPSFPSLLFWLRQKMAILLYCTRCQAPSHSIPFRSEISPYQKWNSVRGIFNSHKPWLQRITSRKQSTFSWEKKYGVRGNRKWIAFDWNFLEFSRAFPQ